MTDIFNALGLGIIAFFIIASIYVSYSVEHLLKLQDGEKPSFWAVPGVLLLGVIVGFATSSGLARIFAALLM